MASTNDLTAYAAEGYGAPDGASCPHIATSPNAMAWHVGVWLNKTGRTRPKGVRCGRGYRMHANEMQLDVTNVNAISRLQ
jgi:hypothetical protein